MKYVFTNTQLDPSGKLYADYTDYVTNAAHDTKLRIFSATLSALILSGMVTPVLALVWYSLVLLNEIFLFLIHRRMLRLGYVDRLNVLLSTMNTGYGTIAWCIATVYLSLTGGLGNIILGTAILIGVLTHTTLNKVSFGHALWVTTIPVVATLLAIPLLIYWQGIVDLKSLIGIFLAFATLILYFMSATRRNAAVKRDLADSLSGLCAANKLLEEHQKHLADLVDARTRELTEEKIKLNQSLEQERHLNEMQSQFVAMASHEFRTPLAIIDGNARRLARKAGANTPDDITSRTDTIRSAVARLTFLIEATIDSSKLASGKIALKRHYFDIRERIEAIIDRQKTMFPRHSVDLDLSAIPADFYADPALLDTVLSSVIDNAFKYSETNPIIRIEAEFDGQGLTLRVTDQGIGIPKNEISSVAMRFFRSSNTSGIPGTGIGLNLVKTLVELHEGRLIIRSEENKWTEITIWLPVAHLETRQLKAV